MNTPLLFQSGYVLDTNTLLHVCTAAASRRSLSRRCGFLCSAVVSEYAAMEETSWSPSAATLFRGPEVEPQQDKSRAIQRPVNQKVLHLLIGNTEGEQRDRDAPLIGGKMTEGFFLYHAVLLSQYPLRYRDTKLPPGSFHFCVFISECPNEPTDDI